MNLQLFLCIAIPTASDLETALLRVPTSKHLWSAGGEARSALGMIAEVALLNGTTAQTIQARFSPDFGWANTTHEKERLARDWPTLKALLDGNTARVVEAVRAVPDEELATEVPRPLAP